MFLTGNSGHPATTIAIGATTPVPLEGIGATCYSTVAGLLAWNGSAWMSSGAEGVTTITFGAFPGASDASLFISDPNITTTSVVHAALQPAATADHSVDEHRVESLTVMAGNVVAGSGFTIYATAGNGLVYGAWSVSWRRS